MFKNFALQAGCLLLQYQNARFNNLESWSISFLYNNNCDWSTKSALSKAEPGHNGINTGDGLPFARLTRKFCGIFRPRFWKKWTQEPHFNNYFYFNFLFALIGELVPFFKLGLANHSRWGGGGEGRGGEVRKGKGKSLFLLSPVPSPFSLPSPQPFSTSAIRRRGLAGASCKNRKTGYTTSVARNSHLTNKP